MFSRSLRSVTRPVHGYVCLSCLVQRVEIALRVSRSYCDNAPKTALNSTSPVPQLLQALTTPLRIENDEGSNSSPASASRVNEDITQGPAEELEKSVCLDHINTFW